MWLFCFPAAQQLTGILFYIHEPMTRYHPYSIFPLGDAALTIDFGNVIDESVNKKVVSLFEVAKKAPHPAIIDVVPAFSSLTVLYDVAALHTEDVLAFEAMVAILENIFSSQQSEDGRPAHHFEIPVCYSERFGWDLPQLSREKNISVEDIIETHTSKSYRVYMLGFLPGFAYMGQLDGRIAMARKNVPRAKVFAGAVGIADRQTGIYPVTSPGGWQIIGRTPVSIFDAHAAQPVLFHPGDQVKFFSITEDEFANYSPGHT